MGLIYETTDESMRAAKDLQSLGAPAVKLLRDVVEHQEVHRKKKSVAAHKLEDAGFIRAVGNNFSCGIDNGVTLYSCLAGEEALDAMDEAF